VCSFDFGIGESIAALAATEAGIGLGAGTALTAAELAAVGGGAASAGGALGTGLTWAELANLGSTAVSTAGTIGNMVNRPGGGMMPKPQPFDPTKLPKALLPRVQANAAANVGGGQSPDFMAGLVDQASGQPGGGLAILDQIRQGLGAQPGQGA
jgi:hypothetical protein